MSAAVMRPPSSPTVAARGARTSASPPYAFTESLLLAVTAALFEGHDRTDLDVTSRGPRDHGGQVEGDIQVFAVEDVVAAKLLLRLDERPVRRDPLAVTDAEDR